MAFPDYSTTPSNNTTIAGQSVAPGGPRDAVGPAIRQLMTDGKLLSDTISLSVSTTALATAIAANTANQEGPVSLGRGTFTGGTPITVRRIGLRGRGMSVSTVSPAISSGVAVPYTANDASWNSAALSDFGISGIGSRQGVGIRTGSDPYTLNAEYNGRTLVQRMRFESLDVAIDRPFGNIGLTVRDCAFESANYHLRVVANPGTANGGVGDVMHAGCSFILNNHFQGALTCVDYMDGKSVIGTCQTTRYGNIMENNPGHVHFYRDCRNEGGFPAFKIADEYNELNSTIGSVTIGGITTNAAWYYGNNNNLTLIDNCAPGRITLVASALLSTACDMSMAVGVSSLDGTSSWINRDVRCFQGKVPGLTLSIAEIQNASSFNSPSFEMPIPVGPAPRKANVLIASTCQSPETWVGTVSVTTTTLTTGNGLPFMQRTQSLPITTGQTLLPPSSFNVSANTYVVWKHLARLVSGPVVTANINGPLSVGGSVIIDNSVMRMHVVIAKTGGALTGLSLYHYAGGGSSVIELGGYAVSSFATVQEALEWANQPLFPVETRPTYTITNSTTQRTLNADTAMPAAAATYSQTDEQTVRDRLAYLEDVLATFIQDQQKGQRPQ